MSVRTSGESYVICVMRRVKLLLGKYGDFIIKGNVNKFGIVGKLIEERPFCLNVKWIMANNNIRPANDTVENNDIATWQMMGNYLGKSGTCVTCILLGT